MSSPQAGWYQDPQDPQGLRYWDGVQWTSQTHQPNQPAAPVLGSYQAPAAPSYQNYSTAQQGSYAAEPVSFKEAAKFLCTKWTFRGRASRSEYWFAALALWLFSFIASIVAGLVGVKAVGYVVFLLMFVAGVNLWLISIRRYHDRGRSGWWLILQGVLSGILTAMFVAVVVASFVSALPGSTGDTKSFGLVAGIVSLLMIANSVWPIVWLSLPGKSEKNRFDD
jgi:uncharacterized membrane protein YhaH (DUF805 family)